MEVRLSGLVLAISGAVSFRIDTCGNWREELSIEIYMLTKKYKCKSTSNEHRDHDNAHF